MPDSSKKQFKIWKAVKDSKAAFMVTPDAAIMVGNKKNFIACDKNGVFLGGGGSISLNTTSENIRRGAFWVHMNDFIRMIPSTIVTPIPSQVPMPPLSLPLTIVADVAVAAAILA